MIVLKGEKHIAELTHGILLDSSTVIMLDGSIRHFRGVGLLTSFCSIFDGKKNVSKQYRPDQMPHYVAPVLGLHCLPVTLLWVSR